MVELIFEVIIYTIIDTIVDSIVFSLFKRIFSGTKLLIGVIAISVVGGILVWWN